MRDVIERSYERHAHWFDEFGKGGELDDLVLTWLQKDTVFYWRHQRKYNVLDPILAHDNESRWLTVGDGMFGTNARYIIDHGCYALPTDICETLLKEAVQMGYIPEYKVENAEALTFADNAFDYVFCKEAYHHFPRPYLALYEMLRVAKKAVVLIEPNDMSSRSIFSLVNNFKESIRRRKYFSIKYGFYEKGIDNYVYPITRRELEHVALALGFNLIAFKGINDYIIPGNENEKLAGNGKIQNTLKRKIWVADVLSKLCLRDYKYLGAIIFKEKPSEAMIKAMMDKQMEVSLLFWHPIRLN